MRNKGYLEKYAEKRGFNRSPGPFSSTEEFSDDQRFVIQKHNASKLHYDFRLEVGGVLKSWAIPKGPSTDPNKKRLAIPTEDHPIDYINFEGVIPEGNYGAGTVIVWDTGTYRNLNENIDMKQSIDKWHVDIMLEGKKLRGGYALIQTGREKRKFWLLLKKKDNNA